MPSVYRPGTALMRCDNVWDEVVCSEPSDVVLPKPRLETEITVSLPSKRRKMNPEMDLPVDLEGGSKKAQLPRGASLAGPVRSSNEPESRVRPPSDQTSRFVFQSDTDTSVVNVGDGARKTGRAVKSNSIKNRATDDTGKTATMERPVLKDRTSLTSAQAVMQIEPISGAGTSISISGEYTRIPAYAFGHIPPCPSLGAHFQCDSTSGSKSDTAGSTAITSSSGSTPATTATTATPVYPFGGLYPLPPPLLAPSLSSLL